jgi:VIT1/CCC1 family predicted Fe2+/Mn2+ transporter
MKESFKRGLSFGITSGIITTLGLIVGLNSGTRMKLAVIGGILTIAIADAFSDALGIHVSEESLRRNSQKAIWEATIMTFITKFIIAITFVLPFLFFELNESVIISILWDFFFL